MTQLRGLRPLVVNYLLTPLPLYVWIPSRRLRKADCGSGRASDHRVPQIGISNLGKESLPSLMMATIRDHEGYLEPARGYWGLFGLGSFPRAAELTMGRPKPLKRAQKAIICIVVDAGKGLSRLVDRIESWDWG